ncbi:MAG: PKD domain-containing protein [Desulfobacteraceae bacterium]
MTESLKKCICWLAFVCLLLPLTGCGSSGDSSATDGPEENAYAISATLCDYDSGEEVTTIDRSTPRKLNVSVLEPSGAAVKNIIVHASFTDSKGEFVDSEDGTALTNEEGKAEMVVVSAEGRSGTGTISVSMDLPSGSDATVPVVEIPFEIDLSGQTTGTVEFVSADPQWIGLLGTTNASGLPSQSIVTFIVKDQWGNPVYNETVNFSFDTLVDMGGIVLTPQTNTTDYQGMVSAVVKSGYVPTAVRVRADVNNSDLFTLSNEIVLSTGYPDQDSFSISVDTFNPNAFRYDGIEVAVTVRAADRNNNPAPSGTAVYFTTEAGSIDSSGFTDDTGACTVTWRSQGTRPSDGRVTILAHAVGEESFRDNNSNGLYDGVVDTLLTDMPEAFLDVNENNRFDELDEIYWDFNSDGMYTESDGKYNGALCGEDTADCAGELIHVRDDIVIAMSDDGSADIDINPSSIVFADINDSQTITVTVADSNGNSMPEGTTIDVEAVNADIDGETSFTVPNSTDPYVVPVALVPKEDEDLATIDSLTVNVTAPKGEVYSESISVTTPPEAAFVFYEEEDFTVQFQDRSVSAPGSEINEWQWDFGYEDKDEEDEDSNQNDDSNEQNPSHTFPDANEYRVTLTVTNDLDQTNTYSETVTPPAESEEE